MQFVTIRERQSGTENFRRQSGGRGESFQFEYVLSPDPTAEGVRLRFGERLPETCQALLWPALAEGAAQGFDELCAYGLRLCCVDLLIQCGHHYEMENSYSAIRNALRWFVRTAIRHWMMPVEPLSAEWLTSDVVALARGIGANAALDGIPALTDALLEAGCDDPLVIEHLLTCPDHAPSCWVVEMILGQSEQT